MKNTITLFFWLFTFWHSASALEGNLLAGMAPTGIEGDYTFYAPSQIVGQDNQTLVTGGFTGSITWGTDTLESGSIRSGFIGVKDSLDQWQWIQKIEGEGYNQINANLALEDGWLIAGVYSDTIAPGEQMLIAEDYQGVFISRLNQAGDFIWSQKMDVPPSGGRQYLSKGQGNDFYLATEFNGVFSAADSIYSSEGKQAAMISRFNSSGEWQQSRLISSRASLSIDAMAEVPGGKLLIGVGYTDSLWIDNQTLVPPGSNSFLIARLDQNLEVDWIKISHGAGRGFLRGIERQAGGYLIYGEFNGEFSFEDETFATEPGQHIFLMKLLNNGHVHWSQSLRGHSHKSAGGLVVGDQQQIYLWTRYRGTLSFLEQEYMTEDFTYQWMITRYKPNGQPQWIAPANNLDNFQAAMGSGSESGVITLYGFNRIDHQEVFSQSFSDLGQKKFELQLMDCDYARWPELATEFILCADEYLDAGEGYASYVWDGMQGQRFYRPNETGWVTLELTNDFGCQWQDTVFAEVLPEFDIAITGNNQICPEGGNTLLTIETQADIIWNTGEQGPLLFVSETGEYHATATDINGCVASDSIMVSNYFTQAPQLYEYYWISPDEVLTLYPGIYASYLWSNGQQDSELYIAGSEYNEGLHEFTLEVYDDNGCYYFHEFEVDISYATTNSEPADGVFPPDDLPLAIPGESMAGDTVFVKEGIAIELEELPTVDECDFIIYPNPGEGPFYISSEYIAANHQKPVQLRVLNTYGQIVLQQNLAEQPQPWQILPQGVLPDGNYFVAVWVDNQVCAVKSIVVLR